MIDFINLYLVPALTLPEHELAPSCVVARLALCLIPCFERAAVCSSA